MSDGYSTSTRYGIRVDNIAYFSGFLINSNRRMVAPYKVTQAKVFNTHLEAQEALLQLEERENEADALPCIGKSRKRRKYNVVKIKTTVEVVNV